MPDSIIPVRKGNGANELWYTMPYHLQPNHSRIISRTLEKKGEKRTHTEREQKEEGKENMEGKMKRKKNEANMRSGRRPSPSDKVAVGWYDQSHGMST